MLCMLELIGYENGHKRKKDRMTKFSELEISSPIVRAIEELGFEQATKIQEQAIPAILKGEDVLGLSNTGTGKTAAFGIPAIESIVAGGKHPQVLIICPTRELVTQVATELRKFSKYKEGVKIVPIYGGQPIDRQIQLLKRGCGIVVGTPGRIMDHLDRKTLKLVHTNMIVLDEADEMLNMGFKEDIEQILTSIPEDRHAQTILFSATMPDAIMRITKQFQQNPVKIEIKSSQRTIDTVEQIYYEVPKGKKTNALRVLLNHYQPDLSMIFCNTKKMVDELCDELNNAGCKAISIHGDMKQMFRARVMEQFRSGNYPILIATDVAARGIDVDNIALVVNYDIPQDNEYYIHRIGRTGRAGRKGKALTLISGKKQKLFIKDIMRYTKTNIVKMPLPTNEEMMRTHRNAFIQDVRKACDEGITQESMEIANELLAEGLAIENILSALISMNYKYEVIDIEDINDKKMKKGVETSTLKINIGRNVNVKPGHIVCAIIEECQVHANVIGHIDVRQSFTLVDVDKNVAVKIIERLNERHIKGKQVTVSFDEGASKKGKKKDRKHTPKRGEKDNKRENRRKKKNRRR